MQRLGPEPGQFRLLKPYKPYHPDDSCNPQPLNPSIQPKAMAATAAVAVAPVLSLPPSLKSGNSELQLLPSGPKGPSTQGFGV